AGPVVARTNNFHELCRLIDAIPVRPAAIPTGLPFASARAAPVRLGSLAARPRLVPPRPPAPEACNEPCVYEALDAPAPVAGHTGHYLPYRPSRIAIPGAAEHPTPLVESVAMGSITAPVPGEVPRLPPSVMARG